MFTPVITGQFKKDFKLCIKRNYNMELIHAAIETLCEFGTLPPEFFPHPLYGKYSGDWEGHIEPDWLLVWHKNEKENLIHLVRTGTHSDLF